MTPETVDFLKGAVCGAAFVLAALVFWAVARWVG